LIEAFSTTFGSGEKSSFGPEACPFVTAQRMNCFSSFAFGVLLGTMTYVNVQMG
jgi:hypothetical protein